MIFDILPTAPRIYFEDFTIRSYHVDVNCKLTLPKLCSFFQEIAGNHTVACGVGWDVLQRENVFWVLSRLKIDVDKYPEWQDKITIRTWSNGLDGLMAVRHFQVLDENGRVMIKAISLWLMVNTQTRRLVKADEFMRDFPVNNERLYDENPAKISPLREPVSCPTVQVAFSETDMNRHMNNVSYIERIIDSYGYDFLLENTIKHFEINFLKEALPGDVLKVEQQSINNKTFLNNIVRADDAAEMVRTLIEWGDI
ncbi:MAG TPA: acyl-ACP thioesterase domain-containing protein [Prolixibacteraceae bacterium]|nr:acyl-ACP thioesterase domain-containing protein [Prolixibacteraceae bacterium]